MVGKIVELNDQDSLNGALLQCFSDSTDLDLRMYSARTDQIETSEG